MLARTPKWRPFTMSEEGQAAFLAEVEAIKAQCRAKLAADRASFWERATEPVSDEQWDHDNERWINGEGEV
jgi:hypothetical protein